MARCIALALLAAGSRALVPARPAPVRAAPLRAECTALVPVNEETIKTSSAVTAGVGGLVLARSRV